MNAMVMPATATEDGDVGWKPDEDTDWRFKLGQCVSHISQNMPSLILSRARTTKGNEVYGVRSFATVDPKRDRMMLGECLVDVVPGSTPCKDCLLHMTGMCPGTLR